MLTKPTWIALATHKPVRLVWTWMFLSWFGRHFTAMTFIQTKHEQTFDENVLKRS